VRRHHLESEVAIRRPVDDVWAFISDLFNSPRARATTLASRKVTPGPLGLGSVVDQRVVFLGFETHVRFTAIEWDPPHVVVASLSGPFIRSARMRVELTATSEGTRKIETYDLELSAGGILLWPLLGPWTRREQARADRKQKALLEASPLDTASE